MTDISLSTFYFISGTSNTEGKNKFKREMCMGGSSFSHAQPTLGDSPAEGIANSADSIGGGGSDFRKLAEVHVGQRGGEMREPLVKPGPLHTKNLTVKAHLIKKPSPGRANCPSQSQMHEADPEMNVNIESNNMQVCLVDRHPSMEKSHSCANISEPEVRIIKKDKEKTDHSSSI